MKGKKFFDLFEGEYILPPIVFSSSGECHIEIPEIEDVVMKKGERFCIKCYFNPNFLGSPVMRKKGDADYGVRVFLPKINDTFTVIQVLKVLPKCAFGVPILLEHGLILSYFEFCRSLYNNSLQFDGFKKTLIARDLNLPSFLDWMEDKPGYVSLSDRIKLENNKLICDKDNLIISLKNNIDVYKNKIRLLEEKRKKTLSSAGEYLKLLKNNKDAENLILNIVQNLE